MKLIALAELVDEVKTWNPARIKDDLDFDYIDIGALDTQSKKIVAAKKLSSSQAPSRARQLVMAGDVLVSTVRPNLNGVAKVDSSLNGATASTGFCVLRPRQGLLNGEYLFQWVKSPTFINYLMAKATGASYPAVSDRIILESQIPLPSLEEQSQISAKLTAVDAIAEKRHRTILEIEAFINSTFIEMFGDPNLNPKNFPLKRLDEVAQIGSGITKGKKYANQALISVPYIRVANVQAGYLDLTEIKTIEVAGPEIQRYLLENGDVLMTEGGDWDKLGRGAVWEASIAPCIHQNHIFKVRPKNEHLLSFFLDALLKTNYAKAYFQKASKQTTNLATINKTQLSGFVFPVPPMNLQKVFCAKRNKVASLEKKFKYSEAQLTALKHSMLLHSFAGH